MVFGRKKKEEAGDEVELLSDEEYDSEAELQKQLLEEKEYEKKVLEDEKKQKKTRKSEGGVTVEQVLLKTEKIEGKLSSFEEARGRIDDRILRVSEQVGELRSMLLEREKSFGILEADFEMIKDVFNDIKPAEFSKELDKKEQSILKNGMHIEKIQNVVESLSIEVGGFRKILEKIKSFENLVDIATEVSEKIATIEETGKYTKRMAAKTESIFGELNKQLMSMEEYKTKLEQTDELANEVVRTVDELAVKLGSSIVKEELRDSLKELDDKLSNKFASSKDLGDKLNQQTKTLEIVEKRLRIMELDKVSLEVGDRIKEFSPGLKQMRRIEQLTRERMDLLSLLKNTEEEFRREEISEKAYTEVKESNEKKLGEIKSIIREDLQSLQMSLEAELGPLLSRSPIVSEEAEVPSAQDKSAPTPEPTESIDHRIDKEMKRMRGGEDSRAVKSPGMTENTGIRSSARAVDNVIGVTSEREVTVEAKARETPEPQETASPEKLKEINEKLKLMETEEGVIQNLYKGLASSSMEEKKRQLLETKYADRLKKIAADIANLRKLKEVRQVSGAVTG